MNWDQIEKELRCRPSPDGQDSAVFWQTFRGNVADEARTTTASEPIGIGRWVGVIAAVAAVVLGLLALRPAPVKPAMRIAASTEVKSVDVVASHGGVIIMTSEDMGGTVLWIADLDLNQTKED